MPHYVALLPFHYYADTVYAAVHTFIAFAPPLDALR